MTDIRNYSLEELEGMLAQWHKPLYHAKQVFPWMYQKGVLSFDEMTNLSLDLREKLKGSFVLKELKLEKLLKSVDGTQKFIFRLEDGNLIESVLIPAEGRKTACLSTQVGCRYSCKFCASGLLGFKRNLDTWEILAQILQITSATHRGSAGKVSHIVFMGCGEPLDNYDNVLKAIRIINSRDGLNIGARRITISTSGVISAIERLAKEGIQIELSVSLHASDEKTRTRLMPINRKYPLKELIAACRKYAALTKRQVTFEYVLIKGMNCSLEAANNLVKLLKGWNAKVNLLIYNPVNEFSYAAPHNEETLKFKQALKKGGLVVTLRKSRGQDIAGACGQLRARYFAVANFLADMRLETITFIFWLIFCAVLYAQEPIFRVCLHDICIEVEIADTDNERQRGLMYRESLPEDKGMLFIFDYKAPHSFWMKHMNFPLDILWIDKDKKIVDIKTNAPPCNEICESLIPGDKAFYVLEVNAGFAKKNKIRMGDRVSF